MNIEGFWQRGPRRRSRGRGENPTNNQVRIRSMFNKTSKNTNLGATKQPSSLTYLSIRERGLVAILFGILVGYPGFYMPYCAVIEKKESVFWSPAVCFGSIVFILLGLIPFILGNYYIVIFGPHEKPNLLGWIFISGALIASFFGMFLFRSYLSSFGYTF